MSMSTSFRNHQACVQDLSGDEKRDTNIKFKEVKYKPYNYKCTYQPKLIKDFLY